MTRADADPEFGAYRLLRELGRGGMGTVHLAMQRTLHRAVALKVLSPSLVGERAMRRFQREARLLAQLEHPGIVKVIDSGVRDGLPFFAMELVAGASLADVLRELAVTGGGRASHDAIRRAVQVRATNVDPACVEGAEWSLPTDRVAAMVAIVADVATALASAHAAGVVHRDVKPSNILIRFDGAVRVADFGIAQQAEDGAMTATGDMAGTPSYMAPEQLRGEPVDHRADVFALGVVLYEALTLQLPFAGTSVVARLAAIDAAPLPAVRLVPGLGRDLAAVLAAALAPVAADRYQTAGELAADLRAVAAGQPVRVRRPSFVEAMWRRARRRPWLVATALLIVMALPVGLLIDHGGRQEVRAEGDRAAIALAELYRLTVGVRLDNAVAAVRAFRVARVEDVPAMERWLVDHGRPLAAELPQFEQLLQQVRAGALPYGEAERAADLAKHPARGALQRIDDELAFLDEQLVAAPGQARAVARREVVVKAREEQLRSLAAARTWRLPNPERQFLHDQVAALVDRLRAFAVGPAATVAYVEAQRDWALQSHERCVVAAADGWHRAAADVAADPRFAGLQLRPQRDLMPLDRDASSGLWEFVHLRSGAPGNETPQRAAGGHLQPTADMGIVFVLLPGGTFSMGAQRVDAAAANHDPQARDEEAPVVTVTLPPFFCGKYEITLEQWARLAAGDSVEVSASDRYSRTRAGRAAMDPADSISQLRAMRVLAEHGLALPDEAQWEYACRAGTATPFPFGARERAVAVANFADARARRAGLPTQDGDLDDGFERVAPIGSLAPNGFGLHDMLGNVGELIVGRTNGRLSIQVPGFDTRRQRYDDAMCMARGGSFRAGVQSLRAAMRRDLMTPDQSQQDVGVRAVRAIEP